MEISEFRVLIKLLFGEKILTVTKDKPVRDFLPSLSMVKSAFLNYILVTQARVKPKILDSQWKSLQAKQLKKPQYGNGP